MRKISGFIVAKAQKCCDWGKCTIYCSFLTERRSIPLFEDRWADNIRGVLSRSSFACTTSGTDPAALLLIKYMWLGKAFARQRRAQFFGFQYYWRRKMPKFCGIQNVMSNVVNMMQNSGTNVISDLDGRTPQGHSKLFTLRGVQSEAPARRKARQNE